MSTTRCLRCRADVERSASSCPNCGLAVPKRQPGPADAGDRSGERTWVWIAAGIIFVFLAIGFISNRLGTVDAGLSSAPFSSDTVGWTQSDLPAPSELPQIEIDSWNWLRDPGFGIDGAVIWTAVVRNNTNDYVRSVRLEFTSYDEGGAVIDTDWSYARGLQPGGTASAKGYATYFGNEKNATLDVKP